MRRKVILASLVCGACAAGLLYRPSAAKPQESPFNEVAAITVGAGGQPIPDTLLSVTKHASLIALTSREAGGVVRLFDSKTGQWVNSGIPLRTGETVTDLKYSPDGRFIAVCAHAGEFIVDDTFLRVYATSDMRQMFAVVGGGYELKPIAFSADGERILRLSAGGGGRPSAFVIAATQSGEVLNRVRIDSKLVGEFRDVAFDPSGEFIFGALDTEVVVWDVDSGRAVVDWKWTGTGAVSALGATADGKRVLACMEEGSIAIFEPARSSKPSLKRLDVPQANPLAPRMIPFYAPWSFNEAAFTADAAHVLRDAGNKVDVYEVSSGRLVRRILLPAASREIDFNYLPAGVIAFRTGEGSGEVIHFAAVPP